MSNQAFHESPADAVRAFVEHLRQNPVESRGDPAALAARFGLETEFVRRALASRSEPAREEGPRGPSRLARGAGGLWAWADGALERAGTSPLRFEAITLLAVIALSVLTAKALPGASIVQASAPSFSLNLRSGLLAPVWIGVLAAQMAAFYRRRMVRYALFGGLLFGTLTGLVVMVSIWTDLQRPEAEGSAVQQGLLVFISGFAMLIVGAVYAGVASLASLAGGWTQIRREERAWERLSRQELLERYFALQGRLDRSVAAPEEPSRWDSLPAVAAVRARPVFAAVARGVGFGLLGLLARVAFATPQALGTLVVLAAATNLSAYALFGATAFLAERASRGAVCGAAYGLAAGLADLVGPMGVDLKATLPLRFMGLGAGVLFYAGLGALCGLGATIQRRAARDRRLQRNDAATLVAEMLEIQWRLQEDATSVTVLVVDAAKSTAMKVGADPLDVEYSFREYQTWIAEVCMGFGGRIHSVAGDGAVVAFADAHAAMAAARRIQTDVTRFNGALNRLPKPFRLRLGLHAGRVAGDLNDVQFTEVIDIAAHVEEIAPVGGIAATGAVVAALGEDGFLPLAREVDGQSVSIALVPTEG